jgi:predicted nucleic acid-binding protein
MAALVLDAEALSALTPAGDAGRRDRVRAAMRAAADRAFVVRVPAVVIAEIARTAAHQTQVEQVMAKFGLQPANVGPATAKRAGRMLGRDGLDSCSLADACVVATAVRFGGGIVATGDPDDLGSLASADPSVSILPL